MRKKKIFFIIAFFIFSLSRTLPIAAAEETPPIIVSVNPDTVEAGPGLVQKIDLSLDIRKDLHLYRSSISFNLKLPEGLTWEKPQLPPGIPTKDPGTGEMIESYHGTLHVPLIVNRWKGNIEPGSTYTGTVEIEYQACTDSYCMFPETVTKTFTIRSTDRVSTVSAIETKPEETGHTKVAAETPETSGGTPSSEEKELTSGEQEAMNWLEKGFFWALLGFFLTGLSLNLTPCVFPVIPITISYFGGQSGKSKGSSFVSALFYAIGIAIMFTVLGLVSSLAGKTWGGLFQDPWFVAGLSMIMLVLSASMFGVFEIVIPAFIMNALGQSKEGIVGSLVMGLTVGVVITPCAAGILIGLIGLVAATGMVFKGTILFFAMGMGLGIPYIILGTFSGLLSKLPMSGMWMVWVRKVFGLVLIGVAIYFLVPQAAILDDQFLYWLGILVTFSGLLVGFLDHSPGYTKTFNIARRIIGILLIAAGLISFGASLHSSSITAESLETETGLVWINYEPSSFDSIIKDGKPVFMDFTAAWCAKCREMEHKTFPEPIVVEKLKSFNLVRVDMTRSKDPAVKAIKEKFDIRGLPTLVFLDSTGKERKDLRQTEFVGPDRLVQILESID